MYNWSVDEKQFKKADPRAYEIWKLEQAINYGEPGERLNEALTKKHWKYLKNKIDPFYREFLALLLWPKKKLAF